MRRRDVVRSAGFLGTAGFTGLVRGEQPTRRANDPAARLATERVTQRTSERATRRVTERASFQPTGRLPLDGTKEAVVGPDGRWAFCAVTDGYATIDLSDPGRPRVAAERRGLLADRSDGPMEQIFDVKLDGETLAVVGPANPVREQTVHGLLLVDVSDPTTPERRGFFETTYPIHNCAFTDGVVYLTGNGASDDGNPLVVVDASDPTRPTELARWRLVDHDDRWANVADGLRPLHDVWVRDGLAALAYWDAGTYLVDVSEPSDPTHLGTLPAVAADEAAASNAQQGFLPPGNHHYVATDETNDLAAVGKESWGAPSEDGFVGGPSGIELYDIADPTEPAKLAEIPPPPTPDPTFGGLWTTAHNFEIRDETLYSAWYDGGVKRHDVSDPTEPTEVSWWVQPNEARFWTARPLTPGETVLAAEFGVRDGAAGLRVFPDAAGSGGDPSALTASPTNGTAATDATPPDGTIAPDTDTSTDASATARSATTDDPATTRTETPGFAVLAALGGAGLAAWRLARTDEE